MAKHTTIKFAKLFHDEFCKLLLSFGAVKIDYRPRKKCKSFTLCEQTNFNLVTKCGNLTVNVQDDTLFCKFDEPERAKPLLYSSYVSRLNLCSGKWNFHFGRLATETEVNTCVMAFDAEIQKILN